MNSGTSALHLALLAAGVGPGDEVITVPFTFVATVAAIQLRRRHAGVRRHRSAIVHDGSVAARTRDHRADERRSCRCISTASRPTWIRSARSPRRHGLCVIEDAAQAHGARYRDRPAGSLGDLACFSFYPSKNLGAYGEGGLIATNDADHAARIRMLRNWGQATKYDHVMPGFNARMQGLQGAILRVKLRHLADWTERAAASRSDTTNCSPAPVSRCRRKCPTPGTSTTSTPCVSHERGAASRRSGRPGFQTGLHYPIPVHLQPAYADLGYRAGAFPIAERAASEVLSLPMFPVLTDGQIETVAVAIRRATVSAG